MRRLAVTALVLALLGGTTAAFALTQALKLERSPILAPRFDRTFAPTCECATAEATLELGLRKADSVDAAIVDRKGEVVRVLGENIERPGGTVLFTWDGRDDAGDVVSDGPYRLRIHLDRERRTIVIPNPVQVDTRAPSVRLLAVRPASFSPDGDGRGDRVLITYSASERGRALVLVNGVARRLARPHGAGRQQAVWPREIAGKPLRPGRYFVGLRLRDLAGNLSDVTRSVAVRVRYVELRRHRLRLSVGAALRFRVDADASVVRWTLRGPGGRVVATGTAASGAVSAPLSPALRPGRYRLRVAVAGWSDRAIVILRGAGHER